MLQERVRFKRVFQLGFCGDWVEIYERMPQPKYEGKFFLAFRKRWRRKVLSLFSGITAGGVENMTESFKKHRFDPTELCSLIASKLGEKFVSLVVR